MSDEIFEVTTSFADVAELGQGYIDRVDGERILLALSRAVPTGAAIRFMVYLVDGTPAFAGAGRSVQVSDQGTSVVASERFETLLDSLTFDERSAPVYEYIVAVRQLAYPESSSVKPEHDAVTAETPYISENTARYSEAVSVMSDDSSLDTDARESLAPVGEVEALPDSIPAAAEAREPYRGASPTPLPAALLTPSSIPADAASDDDVVIAAPQPLYSSVAPEPLPTGILTRPASTAHWVTIAIRRPKPGPRSPRFQAEAGPLKVPSAPPRPKLDRSQWVERAAAPVSVR